MCVAGWQRKPRALGVEIYPGFAACEVLYGDKGEVLGIATGDMGVDKHGVIKDSYTRGMELHGKYTFFAEGARGSLTKMLVKKFALDKDRDPQKYGIGLKELWQIDPAKHKAGRIQHTFGWPLDSKTGGGSFLYHIEDNQIVVGFVVHLNYENPTLSPFDEFQRFKTHPLIAKTLEGGKRLSYGARAITEGGWQSVPKLTVPGGVLIGCAAGFVNVPRIKGSHNAILSGMLAAEETAKALAAGRAHDEVSAVEDTWRDGPIGQDLKKVRNVKPLWSRFGTFIGVPLGGLDMWTNELFDFSLFGTLKHGKADFQTLKPLSEVTPIVYPRPRRQTVVRQTVVGVSVEHEPRGGPAGPSRAEGSVDPDCEKPAGIRRAGEALLSRGRVRSGLCRRSGAQGSVLRHQRAELRALQNLRHQGSRAEHRMDGAGGRRRAELSEHVSGLWRSSSKPKALGIVSTTVDINTMPGIVSGMIELRQTASFSSLVSFTWRSEGPSCHCATNGSSAIGLRW